MTIYQRLGIDPVIDPDEEPKKQQVGDQPQPDLSAQMALLTQKLEELSNEVRALRDESRKKSTAGESGHAADLLSLYIKPFKTGQSEKYSVFWSHPKERYFSEIIPYLAYNVEKTTLLAHLRHIAKKSNPLSEEAASWECVREIIEEFGAAEKRAITIHATTWPSKKG